MRQTVMSVIVAVVLVGCAQGSTTSPGSEPIQHGAGANQPLLKIEHTGGFVPLEYSFTNLPAFALYGDGTVVLPGVQIAIYPAPALPAIFQRHLTEDGIQAVLRAAIDAGLDGDASYTDLGTIGVADAATTVFTLSVGGETHVISAYALGFEGSDKPEGMPDAEFAARVRLLAFLESVGELSSMVPTGSLGDQQPYVGTAGRILVGPYQPDPQLPQESKDWPLPTPLQDFGEATETYGPGYRCGVAEGDGWQALRALAREANERTPWRSGGETFALTFRPLLPDETSC
jgi:hypothetical protein